MLHLDRSSWQKPFTQDDLHLADALAANVSAGIEAAQLLRRQRDLFLETITSLAHRFAWITRLPMFRSSFRQGMATRTRLPRGSRPARISAISPVVRRTATITSSRRL